MQLMFIMITMQDGVRLKLQVLFGVTIDMKERLILIVSIILEVIGTFTTELLQNIISPFLDLNKRLNNKCNIKKREEIF